MNKEIKVTDLKKGQRFFKGMWKDYVRTIKHNGFLVLVCTNGYDERVFKDIVRATDTVLLSSKDSK